MHRDPLEINRAWWDGAAAIHGDDPIYDTKALIAGADSLSQEEETAIAASVGTVDGLDVIHIQCHIGFDTISLARRGARITGLDFSPSIEDLRGIDDQDGFATLTSVEAWASVASYAMTRFYFEGPNSMLRRGGQSKSVSVTLVDLASRWSEFLRSALKKTRASSFSIATGFPLEPLRALLRSSSPEHAHGLDDDPPAIVERAGNLKVLGHRAECTR